MFVLVHRYRVMAAGCAALVIAGVVAAARGSGGLRENLLRVACMLVVCIGAQVPATPQSTVDHGAALTIPTTHPRLWLTGERLGRARAWYRQHGVLPRRDDYLGYAFRYAMTGDQRAARYAIDYALSVTLDTSGVASNAARWYGEVVILTYDWCYDQMSAAERSQLIDRWNGYLTVLRQKEWGGLNMPQSNYFWGYLRNELEWAIATWNENAIASEFLEHAVVSRWEKSFVPHAKTDGLGGVLHEGSQYGRALVEYATIPFLTAGTLGRDLFNETNYFREAVYYIIYATAPAPTALRGQNNRFWELFPFSDDERFGDGGNAEAVSWANFMAAAADIWREEAVGQYARAWRSMIASPASPWIEAAVESGGEVRHFSTLPLDYYAPGPRYFYGRSHWGAESTAIHLQLGNANDGGAHDHDDYGNWQVWRNGRWLSRETVGYARQIAGYGGQGSAEVRDALAHNALLLNRKGFARGKRNGVPIVRHVETKPGFSYSAVNLTPAYRNDQVPFRRPELDNEAAGNVEREFVFIRALDVLLIFDRIESAAAPGRPADQVTKTFLAHFEQEPTVQDGNHVLATNGDQALRLTTLLPMQPQYRVVPEGGAIGQYRLELETTGERLSYFLHVIHGRSTDGPDIESAVTDRDDIFVVSLKHPELGFVRVDFRKGREANGGGIACAKSALPEQVAAFHRGIQKIEVGVDGPVWEQLEGDANLSNCPVPSVTAVPANIRRGQRAARPRR